MRALIFFLSPCLALAAPGQITTKVGSSSSTGTANVDFLGRVENTDSFTTTVSVKSPSFINNNFSLRMAATRAKNDYSNYILRDRFGRETFLSESFSSSENNLEAGLDFARGPHLAAITHSRSVGATPFPYHSNNISYSISPWNGSTQFGLGFSSSRQEQPANFYIDPRDFRNRVRPRSLTSQREDLFYEQTITEKLKSRATIFRGNRFEDRPTHFGGELRLAYALLDNLALRLDSGLLRERRNETLRDDRGYFSARWAELQAGYEPFLDLIFTIAIGTTIEHEDRPWDKVRRQVGSDSLGLKTSYRQANWLASLSANATRTNTSYRNRALSGDFTWEF